MPPHSSQGSDRISGFLCKMPGGKCLMTTGKAAAILVLALCCILALDIGTASAKLKMAASFYPLAHFAGQVAGDQAEVATIMPPGSEPHEYEPPPGDIKKIYESSFFLFNGAGLDPWAERLREDLVKNGTAVMEMAALFSQWEIAGKASDHGHDDHTEGETDPHIWLDPLIAAAEVGAIRDALIRIDPLNQEQYRRNSTAYSMKLNKLHAQFEEGLKSCRTRKIIVTHNAFNYLGRRYNLSIHAITGISPEEEPSPRKMVELTKFALKEDIRHIFFEPLASSKLAKTIAREIGAATLVLNPLGGLTEDDISRGRTYISVMKDNLYNLRIAMGCN